MQTHDDFSPALVEALEERARELLDRWETLDTADDPCWLNWCSLQGLEEEISSLLKIAQAARMELGLGHRKQDLVEDPTFWRHHKRDARRTA